MSDYTAFISYRHKPLDTKTAQWLHRKLEAYRVPSSATKKLGVAKRVGRIFRDQEELSASSSLTDVLKDALQASGHLIVICSTQTPASKWVNEEIEHFKLLGRADKILVVLVEGEPEESFPESLRNAENEPLAIDLRGMNRGQRRLALLRLIAPLLGCSFDDLRQREAARRQRRMAAIAGSSFVMAAAFLCLAILAIFSRFDAIKQQAIAVEQRDIAEEQRTEAEFQTKLGFQRLAGIYYDRSLNDEDPHSRLAWSWLTAGAEHVAGRTERASQRTRALLAQSHIPTSVIIHPGPPAKSWVHSAGQRGVTSGTDGIIVIWDLTSEQPIKTLSGYGDEVPEIAFSDDGQRLLAVWPTHSVLLSAADGTVLNEYKLTLEDQNIGLFEPHEDPSQGTVRFEDSVLLQNGSAVLITNSGISGPGLGIILRANETPARFDTGIERISYLAPLSDDPSRCFAYGSGTRYIESISTSIDKERDEAINQFEQANEDVPVDRFCFINSETMQRQQRYLVWQSDSDVLWFDARSMTAYAYDDSSGTLIRFREWPDTSAEALQWFPKKDGFPQCQQVDDTLFISVRDDELQGDRLYLLSRDFDEASLRDITKDGFGVNELVAINNTLLTIETQVIEQQFTVPIWHQWVRLRDPEGNIIAERRVPDRTGSISVDGQVVPIGEEGDPILILESKRLDIVGVLPSPPYALNQETRLIQAIGTSDSSVSIPHIGTILKYQGLIPATAVERFFDADIHNLDYMPDGSLLVKQEPEEYDEPSRITRLDAQTGKTMATGEIGLSRRPVSPAQAGAGLVMLSPRHQPHLVDLATLDVLASNAEDPDSEYEIRLHNFDSVNKQVLLTHNTWIEDGEHFETKLSWHPLGSQETIVTTKIKGEVATVVANPSRTLLACLVYALEDNGPKSLYLLDYKTLDVQAGPWALPNDATDPWLDESGIVGCMDQIVTPARVVLLDTRLPASSQSEPITSDELDDWVIAEAGQAPVLIGFHEDPIDGKLIGLDRKTGQKRWQIAASSKAVLAPDGGRFAYNDAFNQLRIADAATGKPIGMPLIGNDQGDVLKPTWSADGSIIAGQKVVSFGPREVFIFHRDGYRYPYSIPDCHAFAISPDGSSLTYTDQRRVVIVRLTSEKPLSAGLMSTWQIATTRRVVDANGALVMAEPEVYRDAVMKANATIKPEPARGD